jgi:hypothetical protein
LKTLGPERFKRVFEATHEQVGDGEWVEKTVFEGLPESHQTYLREKGVSEYGAWVDAAKTAMAGYAVEGEDGKYDLVEAVQGGVSDDVFNAIGMDSGSVEEARKVADALTRVGVYGTADGSYDVVAGLKAGALGADFVAVGISEDDVKKAQEIVEFEGTMGGYGKTDAEGNTSYDLEAAYRAGVSVETLERYFGADVARDTKVSVDFQAAMEPYKTGTDAEGRVTYDVAAAVAGGVSASLIRHNFGRDVYDEAKTASQTSGVADRYEVAEGKYNVYAALARGEDRGVLEATFGKADVETADAEYRRLQGLVGKSVVEGGIEQKDLDVLVSQGPEAYEKQINEKTETETHRKVTSQGSDYWVEKSWYDGLSDSEKKEFTDTGSVTPRVEFTNKKGEKQSVEGKVWARMSARERLESMGVKDPTADEYVAVYLEKKGYGQDPIWYAVGKKWGYWEAYDKPRFVRQGWASLEWEWETGELKFYNDEGRKSYEAYKRNRENYADAGFVDYREQFGWRKALREAAIKTVSELGLPAVEVVRKDVGVKDISGVDWAVTALGVVGWGTAVVAAGFKAPVIATSRVGGIATRELSLARPVGLVGKVSGVVAKPVVKAVVGTSKVVGKTPTVVPRVSVSSGWGVTSITMKPMTVGEVVSWSGRTTAGVGRGVWRMPSGMEKAMWSPVTGEVTTSPLRVGEATELFGAAAMETAQLAPAAVRGVRAGVAKAVGRVGRTELLVGKGVRVTPSKVVTWGEHGTVPFERAVVPYGYDFSSALGIFRQVRIAPVAEVGRGMGRVVTVGEAAQWTWAAPGRLYGATLGRDVGELFGTGKGWAARQRIPMWRPTGASKWIETSTGRLVRAPGEPWMTVGELGGVGERAVKGVAMVPVDIGKGLGGFMGEKAAWTWRSKWIPRRGVKVLQDEVVWRPTGVVEGGAPSTALVPYGYRPGFVLGEVVKFERGWKLTSPEALYRATKAGVAGKVRGVSGFVKGLPETPLGYRTVRMKPLTTEISLERSLVPQGYDWSGAVGRYRVGEFRYPVTPRYLMGEARWQVGAPVRWVKGMDVPGAGRLSAEVQGARELLQRARIGVSGVVSDVRGFGGGVYGEIMRPRTIRMERYVEGGYRELPSIGLGAPEAVGRLPLATEVKLLPAARMAEIKAPVPRPSSAPLPGASKEPSVYLKGLREEDIVTKGRAGPAGELMGIPMEPGVSMGRAGAGVPAFGPSIPVEPPPMVMRPFPRGPVIPSAADVVGEAQRILEEARAVIPAERYLPALRSEVGLTVRATPVRVVPPHVVEPPLLLGPGKVSLLPHISPPSGIGTLGRLSTEVRGWISRSSRLWEREVRPLIRPRTREEWFRAQRGAVGRPKYYPSDIALKPLPETARKLKPTRVIERPETAEAVRQAERFLEELARRRVTSAPVLPPSNVFPSITPSIPGAEGQVLNVSVRLRPGWTQRAAEQWKLAEQELMTRRGLYGGVTITPWPTGPSWGGAYRPPVLPPQVPVVGMAVPIVASPEVSQLGIGGIAWGFPYLSGEGIGAGGVGREVSPVGLGLQFPEISAAWKYGWGARYEPREFVEWRHQEGVLPEVSRVVSQKVSWAEKVAPYEAPLERAEPYDVPAPILEPVPEPYPDVERAVRERTATERGLLPLAWLPGGKGEEGEKPGEMEGKEVLWERLPVVEEALYVHMPVLPTAPITGSVLEPRGLKLWEEEVLRPRRVYKRARLGRARVVKRKRSSPAVKVIR